MPVASPIPSFETRAFGAAAPIAPIDTSPAETVAAVPTKARVVPDASASAIKTPMSMIPPPSPSLMTVAFTSESARTRRSPATRKTPPPVAEVDAFMGAPTKASTIPSTPASITTPRPLNPPIDLSSGVALASMVTGVAGRPPPGSRLPASTRSEAASRRTLSRM